MNQDRKTDWQKDAVERDLRVDSPSLQARFQAFCPSAPLPWESGIGRERATIYDALGNEVCRFPIGCPETPGMIAMVILAVNTCCGYRAALANPEDTDAQVQR